MVGLIIMIVPTLIVLGVYRWLARWLIRLSGRVSPFLQTLLARGQGPATAILMIIVLGMCLPGAQFAADPTVAIARALLVAFILAIGWVAAIALDVGVEIYLRRFRTDTEDNLLARKHITQMQILQRAARTVLGIITIGAALMTFAAVRQYGVSLLASAGAAGLILGLAARPVLSNLLAGIQIAMTQPIRVEDQVVVQGENGWIETITSTYVVIRLWDLRRMVVPLTYFIEQPFQNWTYESAEQIGAVVLRVDPTVALDKLRQQLDRILRESKLWDGKVAKLQVTDIPDGKVELRALVSARNPGQTWDLRCEVREKLIGFLRDGGAAEAVPEPPEETGHPGEHPGEQDAAAELAAGDGRLALAARRADASSRR
ncbi:MAG TPA: mechanosensitive ion channel family protein [Stellaceae bacterium]